MPKYYSGACEACHETFTNLSGWQMIKARIKHRHLLSAIISSSASFYIQEDYIDSDEMFGDIELQEVKH